MGCYPQDHGPFGIFLRTALVSIVTLNDQGSIPSVPEALPSLRHGYEGHTQTSSLIIVSFE